MINKAILMGRLTADPELRQTPSGTSVCTFTVAVNRPYRADKEQQADFIEVVAWKGAAEFVSRYFSKGKMIIVEGSIQTRGYEDRNGNKRKAVEVVANNVQFGESKPKADVNIRCDEPGQVGPAEPADDYEPMDPTDSDDLPF